MKCEIYVYDKARSKYRLDIPENIQLNITYSFSDLTSPTTIADNYSKTITVPGTANNNKIFGYIYKFNRQIVSGYDVLGFNYNPSKRVSYDLVINDVLFQKGWLKLNKVKQVLGNVEYDITLYGDVSNFLHKLSNGDIEDSENKLLYSLSFPNNLSHIINKDTLKSFIDQTNSLSGWMTYIRANNGLYDEFESSKYVCGNPGDVTQLFVVKDILNGLEFDELQKRECRSYYQRPALSVYGILDRIQNDEKEFNITYDKSFFNDNNPYYTKSYLTMPLISQYEQSNSATGNITYETTTVRDTSTYLPIQASDTSFISGNYIRNSYIPGNKTIYLEYEVSIKPTITDSTYTPTTATRTFQIKNLTDNEVFNSRAFFEGTNAIGYSTAAFGTLYDAPCKFKLSNNATSGDAYWDCSALWPLYKNGGITYYFPCRKVIVGYDLNNSFNTARGRLGVVVYIPSRVYCEELDKYFNATYSVSIRPISKPNSLQNVNLNMYYPASYGWTGKDIVLEGTQAIRSNYEINKDNIIDKETTQSEFLINYCKLFGLILDTDRKGNLTIKSRNSYFADHQILDWTDKLDYYQTIETTPLTFDTKYLSFKYNNSDSKYENFYANKYNIDYGEAKIRTGYEFNKDTKDIFESIFNNTVMSKETDRFLLNDAMVVERNSSFVLPAYFNKGDNNRESIDTRFNLLFDNGIKSVSSNDEYWITDDVPVMLDEDAGGGEYCWLNCTDASVALLGAATKMSYYRQHSTLYKSGDTICSFDINYPRENYAKISINEYPETATIYSQFWQNYINEIYNVNTKEITAYFNLSFNDMNNFSFKNFVLIGDTLFHPVKIDNYNPLTNGTTKVTLVKVNDILNYTSGQVVPEITGTYYSVRTSFAKACRLDYPNEVQEGGTLICNIIKTDPLGHIRVEECEIIMGGTALNPENYIDTETGVLTIPNVTGDIIIGISCDVVEEGGGGEEPGPDIPGGGDDPDEPIEPNVYSISIAKAENCTIAYSDSSITEGETFTCSILIDGENGGEVVIADSFVTMGGTTLDFNTIFDAENNTITISNVTGDIVLGIVCDVVVLYQVTINKTGCEVDGMPKVQAGTTYTANIIYDYGYELTSAEIYMNGVQLDNATHIIDNTITIPNVDGNIYIKVVCEIIKYSVTITTKHCEVDGPSYVNHDATYTGRVIPVDPDWAVDYDVTRIQIGDYVHNANDFIVNNIITIPTVTADVSMYIECADQYWRVGAYGSMCTITGPDKVLKNGTYTATIDIDEGYYIDYSQCLVTMGETRLNPGDYITNTKITIPNVTGPLAISVVCVEQIDTYSVTFDSSWCGISGDRYATEHSTYKATITPRNSDYELDYNNCKVTMNGVELSLDDVLDGWEISIPNVDGPITIKMYCVSKYWYVSSTVENCVISGPDKVLKGESYTANIDNYNGYELSSVSVKMGSTTLNQSSYLNGYRITIPNVTGNLTINAKCTLMTYDVNVDVKNCRVDGPSSVDYNGTYVGTIYPIDPDYAVDFNNSVINYGNYTLDPSEFIVNNKITIENVTADISMYIVCEDQYYDVGTSASGCTITGPDKVLRDSSYSATINVNSGYALDLSQCLIVMGGTTLNPADYISNNKINISKVTGTLSISIVCVEQLDTYTVTFSGLVDCTITGNNYATEKSTYTATIVPTNSDYVVNTTTSKITMNGTTLSLSSVISGNKINIPNVNGNIVITIKCESKYWYVTTTGTNCTVSSPTKVLKNASYSATITPNANYVVNTSTTTIMMGGTLLNNSNYITNNKINITKVTGDLVINVRCSLKTYTVTKSGTNCTVNGNTSITHGSTYTATILPYNNYAVDIGKCSIKMGGTTLTASNYISGNSISIPNVTGALTITIVCSYVPQLFDVTWTTTDCSISGLTTATENTKYTATVMPKNSDYAIDLSRSTIKMGGTILTVANYISGNTITIPSVTGDVVMNIVCTNQYYTVTYNATNCTIDGPAKTLKNNSFTATITPDADYVTDLTKCTITMGGTALTTSWYISNNVIEIPTVTGDLVITVECVKNSSTQAKVTCVINDAGAFSTIIGNYLGNVASTNTAPLLYPFVPLKVTKDGTNVNVEFDTNVTTRILNIASACYVHVQYTNPTTGVAQNFAARVTTTNLASLRAGENIKITAFATIGGGTLPLPRDI